MGCRHIGSKLQFRIGQSPLTSLELMRGEFLPGKRRLFVSQMSIDRVNHHFISSVNVAPILLMRPRYLNRILYVHSYRQGHHPTRWGICNAMLEIRLPCANPKLESSRCQNAPPNAQSSAPFIPHSLSLTCSTLRLESLPVQESPTVSHPAD